MNITQLKKALKSKKRSTRYYKRLEAKTQANIQGVLTSMPKATNIHKFHYNKRDKIRAKLADNYQKINRLEELIKKGGENKCTIFLK